MKSFFLELWDRAFTRELFASDLSCLLVFVSIGAAFVIFSLSHKLLFRKQNDEYLDKFRRRKKKIHNEIKTFQDTSKALRLIGIIESVGVCYFLAMPMILIVSTYKPSGSDSAPFYIFLCNATFLLVLLPTLVIAGAYFHYRFFRNTELYERMVEVLPY